MKIFNSAVMPLEGKYEMKKLTIEEFKDLINEVIENEGIESYLGMKSNIRVLNDMFPNIEFRYHRMKAVELENGEEYLVMRLGKSFKRSKIRKRLKPNDFEYLLVKYSN